MIMPIGVENIRILIKGRFFVRSSESKRKLKKMKITNSVLLRLFVINNKKEPPCFLSSAYEVFIYQHYKNWIHYPKGPG